MSTLHECLTTVKHLHILADRYEKPVCVHGDYYAVVVEKPGREPIAYLAPRSEAHTLDERAGAVV